MSALHSQGGPYPEPGLVIPIWPWLALALGLLSAPCQTQLDELVYSVGTIREVGTRKPGLCGEIESPYATGGYS